MISRHIHGHAARAGPENPTQSNCPSTGLAVGSIIYFNWWSSFGGQAHPSISVPSAWAPGRPSHCQIRQIVVFGYVCRNRMNCWSVLTDMSLSSRAGGQVPLTFWEGRSTRTERLQACSRCFGLEYCDKQNRSIRGEHLFVHGETRRIPFCPRSHAKGREEHHGRVGFSVRSCATVRGSVALCSP